MRYAGPFASVPTAAVFDTRMTPGILRVLAALASYADEYRRCSRSMKQVAERLGVQRQALNRPIRKLQDWGYLEVMHQFRPDGGKASNEYRILFDQPMPPALAVPPPCNTMLHTPCNTTRTYPCNTMLHLFKIREIKRVRSLILIQSLLPRERE